ncbi:MAG: YlbF family regulator [Ruminococcus sp.]|nr:YlbF family regulator [Ruminococcus sp.]
MDVMQMTRELGKAIQNDDRYIAYNLAKQVNNEDKELQADIEKFTELKKELDLAMIEENSEKMNIIDSEIKIIYKKIMDNEHMTAFSNAQNALETLISNINQLISMCANGADPDTCEIPTGCSGSCATCGGCA